MDSFFRELSAIEGADVRADVPLRERTSFRIGGCADFSASVHSSEAAASVLRLCRKAAVPCFLMGLGTNLLASDEGIRGVALSMGHGLVRESVEESEGVVRITLGAEVSLGRLVSLMDRAGAVGFSRLAGIPGTVGGALAMNAGTRGGSVSEFVEKIILAGPDGLSDLPAEAAGFGYRSCRALDAGTLAAGAVFRARLGTQEEIEAERSAFREAMAKRRVTQPAMPSAGCVFRNPEGRSAGALIDGCGLKGMCVGDALVSPVHANFIVNAGRASSGDVLRLMREVQAAVVRETGVRLEPEIRLIGEFQLGGLPEGARVLEDLAAVRETR